MTLLYTMEINLWKILCFDFIVLFATYKVIPEQYQRETISLLLYIIVKKYLQNKNVYAYLYDMRGGKGEKEGVYIIDMHSYKL